MTARSVSPNRPISNVKSLTKHNYVNYKNGVYEGDMVQYQKNGPGIFIHDSGEVFIGSFWMDKVQGEGIIFFRDGGYLYGEFAKSMLNGFGILCCGQYFLLSSWVHNKMNGDVFLFDKSQMSWKHSVFKNNKKMKDISQIQVHQLEDYPLEMLRKPKLMEKIIDIIYLRLNFLNHLKNIRVIQSQSNKNQLFVGYSNKHGPQGLGVLLHRNFEKTISIMGYFNHGQLWGLGRVKFDNGDVYEGVLRQDKLEGNGFYYIQKTGQYIYGKFLSNQCKQIIQIG